jgi:hypothetical protein
MNLCSERLNQSACAYPCGIIQMQDIKTAFGKGESKDGDKKDDKQDDKKEAETGRAGPLYDPDDSMGAVLMADKLEEVRRCRDLYLACTEGADAKCFAHMRRPSRTSSTSSQTRLHVHSHMHANAYAGLSKCSRIAASYDVAFGRGWQRT